MNALLFALFVLATISRTGSPARARLGTAGPVSGVAQPSRSDAAGALDAGAAVPSSRSGRGAPPQADDAPLVVPAVHVPVLRELVDQWNAALDAGDDPARSRAGAALVGAVEFLLNQHEARLLASGEAS